MACCQEMSAWAESVALSGLPHGYWAGRGRQDRLPHQQRKRLSIDAHRPPIAPGERASLPPPSPQILPRELQNARKRAEALWPSEFRDRFACMSNAANQLSLPQPAQRQASDAERRIGPGEQLITLTAAAKVLPKVDGRKVAVCTLWRWCRRGMRGLFLAYVRVGPTTRLGPAFHRQTAGCSSAGSASSGGNVQT